MLYLERNDSGNQVVKILINCFNKALVGCSQYHLGVLQQPAGGESGQDQCLRWEGRGVGEVPDLTACPFPELSWAVLHPLISCPWSWNTQGSPRDVSVSAFGAILTDLEDTTSINMTLYNLLIKAPAELVRYWARLRTNLHHEFSKAPSSFKGQAFSAPELEWENKLTLKKATPLHDKGE